MKVEFEDLPQKVVEITKRSILDTLGVMLPPTTLEPACTAIYRMVQEGREGAESSLIGFGGKASCQTAALVNGSLCHCMDYDDSVDSLRGGTMDFLTHPTGSTFPAALAIAERLGNVSGRAFIAAVALGIDLNVRLASALKGRVLGDYSWFGVTSFGVFGAAAACGKLLGLTEAQLVNAFGMSLHRAFGMGEDLISPESHIRSIRDGFTNQGGLLAASMAKHGVIGSKDSIEKLYRNLFNNDYQPEIITSGLGEEFGGLNDGFKPWPSCRATHSFAEAALNLVRTHCIEPDNVARVTCTVSEFGRDALFTPIEAKRRPKLMIAAKVSLPFVIGVAFTRKELLIQHFLDQNLADPDVLRMADKVGFEVNPQFGTLAPGVVTVKMEDGRSLTQRVDIISGHPLKPMRDEDLIAKFRDCARYSKLAMPGDRVEQVVDKVMRLEEASDIQELTGLLG